MKKVGGIYIFTMANYIIKKIEVNQSKLQKLLYYAHAKNLVDFKESLTNTGVEAWGSGPIFRNLFQQIKNYDKNAIIKEPIGKI